MWLVGTYRSLRTGDTMHIRSQAYCILDKQCELRFKDVLGIDQELYSMAEITGTRIGCISHSRMVLGWPRTCVMCLYPG